MNLLGKCNIYRCGFAVSSNEERIHVLRSQNIIPVELSRLFYLDFKDGCPRLDIRRLNTLLWWKRSNRKAVFIIFLAFGLSVVLRVNHHSL